MLVLARKGSSCRSGLDLRSRVIMLMRVDFDPKPSICTLCTLSAICVMRTCLFQVTDDNSSCRSGLDISMTTQRKIRPKLSICMLCALSAGQTSCHAAGCILRMSQRGCEIHATMVWPASKAMEPFTCARWLIAQKKDTKNVTLDVSASAVGKFQRGSSDVAPLCFPHWRNLR